MSADYLTVFISISAHVANVVRTLRRVGQATVRRALRGEAVDAAGAPGDLGTAELLDGRDAREGPEVAVRDPGELLLHVLEELPSDIQAGVRTMLCLRLETHGGIVAVHRRKMRNEALHMIGTNSPATSVGVLVVRTGRMPRQTDENRAIRTVWMGRTGR